MAESKEKLFDQFPPVSTQEWKEKVVADLKGADFDKKLVWRTNEGFNVNPHVPCRRHSEFEYDRFSSR